MSKNTFSNSPSQLAEKEITLPFTVGKLFAIAPLLILGLIMIGIYFTGIIQLMMANRELREYDHEAKGIEYLNWALSANPRLAEAYAKRASAKLNLEEQKSFAADYTEARQDIAQAMKLDPKNFDYCEISLKVEHAAHNYRKELEGYARLFELDRYGSTTKYLDRADAYYLTGDFKSERADREKVVDQESENLKTAGLYASSMRRSRAEQYRYLNQVDNAIKDYEASVKEDPEQSKLLSLAYLYEHSGRLSQALNVYNKLIEFESSDKVKQELFSRTDCAHYRRANLYLKLGQNEKALADAEFLRKGELGDCASRIAFRAKVLDLLGRRAEAAAERKAATDSYRVTINELPKDCDAKSKADAYATRADFYENDRQWKNALTDYRVALSVDPNAWRYAECARMYVKLGDYDNAINFFSKGITPQSDARELERAYTGLAEAHLLQHKPALAIEDSTKAIAENGHVDGEAISWRARAYRQAGKDELAKIDENEALGLEFSPLPDI